MNRLKRVPDSPPSTPQRRAGLIVETEPPAASPRRLINPKLQLGLEISYRKACRASPTGSTTNRAFLRPAEPSPFPCRQRGDRQPLAEPSLQPGESRRYQ